MAGQRSTDDQPCYLPLSAPQRGMWFAETLSADYSINVAQYIDIKHAEGALDVELFVDCCEHVGKQVQSPYARLSLSEGMPVQYVDVAYNQHVDVYDFRSESDPETAAITWMRAEYKNPIDVMADQLIVVAVLKISDTQTIWYSRAHHLILDGYAALTLVKRVLDRYNAIRRGVDYVDPPAATLAELVEFEADYQAGSRRLRDQEYWRDRIVGMPERVTLAHSAALVELSADNILSGSEIGWQLQRKLETAAKELNGSVAVLLAAAFGAFLARLAGTGDVVLSLPVTGRTTAKTRNAGGMLSNVLPIRLREVTSKTVREVVAAAQLELTGALRHQRYRSEEILRDSGLSAGRMGFGPTINMVFFDTPLTIEGADLEYRILSSGALEDLLLNLYQAGPGEPIVIDLHGNPGLYTPADIDGHLKRFIAFLERFISAPDRGVDELELLVAGEVEKLRQTAGAPEPHEATLATIFDTVAREHPNDVAVTFASDAVTYRELDERSNRLARLLIERGAGPDTIVALAAPRSVELMVALWAIAKSGAAYTPIDREYPLDRVEFMIADSEAQLGVTIGDPPATVATDRFDWIQIDAPDVAAIVGEHSADPIGDADRNAPLRPDHLAYVIYTSGSTGQPKGVEVTHRGILGFATSLHATMGLDIHHRVSGLTSPSFDASVAEYLLAFLSGGSLHYRPADAVAGKPLEQFLREAEVDTLILTPTVLATLDPQLLPAIETVMVGGEALPTALRDAWAECTSIHNAYGPTEATVALTHSHELKPGESVPIGVAAHGVELFILDNALREVPVGVLGELYAASPGLARGYRRHAGKTAERFVANPFGQAGSRMYRTGDIVRWKPDSVGDLQLEYHGRSDDQIKMRGLRIELGEISAGARRHPGVSAAVVVGVDAEGVPVPTGVAQIAELAAYLVPDEAEIDLHELRQNLRSALPEYMVPTRYAVVDALPSTPVGKLDRQALPAADVLGGVDHYIAPVGAVEKTVVSLLADLLGVDRIGTGDNLFALGADSLTAAKFTSLAREQAHLELSLADVFNSPTVGDMARAARLVDVDGPVLSRYPRTNSIPVSYPQTRLWVINRIDPASGAYNIPGVVRLTEVVDEAALQGAVADLVERHEPLRTLFPAGDDGTPYQEILGTQAALARGIFDTLDCSAAELDELLTEITSAGFELVTELPARFRLIRVHDGAEPSFVLALALHHIAGDGQSMGPLIGDLLMAYAARISGTEPPWPALPVQYADYSLWQRDRLGDADDPESLLAVQTAYWTQELADLPALLALPTDNPRPAVPSGQGGFVDSRLDAETVEALRRLAADQHVTLFTVFQAIAAILLGQLTGASDIPIGAAVAGRDDAQLRGLVGMFVNSVAIRHRLSEGLTTREFLQRTNQVISGAISHADVPFERVVDAVGAARARDHSPIFQVELVMQHDEVERALAGVEDVEIVESRVAAAKFDLGFSAVEYGPDASTPNEIALGLNYATDLFLPQTAERILGYFCRIAQRFATDADALSLPITELSAFTRAELAVASRAARGAAVTVRPQTLPGLVAAQIASVPDAIALSFDRRDMTYREFGDRVASLSRKLRSSGVAAETAVAVAIPRSFELLIAVHAVVAAGGHYVPLDVRQPAERLSYMCDAANVQVLLTIDDLVDVIPAAVTADLKMLTVNANAPVAATIAGALELPKHGSVAAYTLFTSGSTGRPKGVTVEHEAIVNRLAWMQDFYPLGPGDSVLHKTPVTFDVSVWEMFWPLIVGARMVIAESDRHGEPEYLHQVIMAESITVLHFVPSMLAAFVDALGPERIAELDSLHTVFTSGEALAPAPANALLRALPETKMYNLYGPTEAAVDVTAEPVAIGTKAIPIGIPVWNTECFVLDRHLRMLPPGVPGELYLGGIQLARGYSSLPGLTAERFVADPYGPPGARLYRTGDLVKWNADSRLEYLGRTDFQVKLRGQRLELGEIESVLSGVEGVVHAAAGLARFPSGDQLVGYLAPEHVDLAVAREAVAAALPEYMRPTLWVALAEMPLNSAGKADRRALPIPTLPDIEYIAPAGRIEELVADVFAEVIGCETVGITESFFELGGNSLSATKVIARLGAELDRTLPIAAIFDAPSVVELAEYIRNAEDNFHRPALKPRGRGDCGPLSSVQRGMWLVNRADPASPVYNIGFALRMTGDLDLGALRQAAYDVVTRHESLRTRYPLIDDDPTQVVIGADEMIASMDYREIDVIGDVENAIADIAGQGFDVTTAPPIRMAVLKVGPQDFVTVTVIHHIAADGPSTIPLARDLMMAYGARVGGIEPQWEPLPAQYLDFSLWQQTWLESTEHDNVPESQRQLDYWVKRLSGAPVRLTLPTDHTRPRVPDYRGGLVEFEISADLTRRLEILARQQHATLFMVTEAAFAVLLSKLSMQRDITIGTPHGGRSDRKLDDVVGMFVNTLAMRTQLLDGEKFAEFLGRVRSDVMTDLDHADVAFDTVVAAALDRIPTDYNPIYQAMFAFQNFYFPTVELAGLAIAPMSEQVLPAKVDLQLTLFPNDPSSPGSADLPMRAQMLYASALFDVATVERFAERYVRVLEQIAELPQVAIGDIAIDIASDVSPAEAEVVEARSLSELVSEASAIAPDAEAVSLAGAAANFADLSTTVAVIESVVPDPDSALTTALMSVLPSLATGGAEQLGDVLIQLRERAEKAIGAMAPASAKSEPNSTEGMINS
ncbi:MAG: amino acid adenylation domain-containing protein [Gordonia sp. (in: high G+C Gram-positive bacteria)]